jgi:serine phosphatase RsbU (regulator of sigma subunit)
VRDQRDRGGRGDRRRLTGLYYRRGRQRAAASDTLPPGLADDDRFAILTLDRRLWLEPYSGRALELTGNLAAFREEYYRGHGGGWRDLIPLPRETLLELRWLHDLRRLLPKVSALRLFTPTGQAWLNPYSGELDPKVRLRDGQIDHATLNEMANALGTCDAATSAQPLNQARIDALRQQYGCRIVPDPGASGEGAAGSHPGDDSRQAETRQAEQTSHDLAVAGQIQKRILAPLPAVAGFELAVHYAPCADVGGDFYEVLPLADGRILLMLGDVSGHGMQGALHVATLIKIVRIFSRENPELLDLVGRINQEIRPDLLPGQFVTLFSALLDPVARSLTCLLAGHHPLIIINPDHRHPVRLVGNRGMALGLVDREEFLAGLRPDVVGLYPGDVLLQYSDGIEEARPLIDGAEEFGRNRIFAHLFEHYALPLQELVDGLARRVVEYAGGGAEDDVTILAVAVDDAAPAAGGGPPSPLPVL